MLDLTTFDYDSQAVRTVMIDGAPWFVAVDVCRILDIANASQAVARLDEDEFRSIDPIQYIGSSVAGGGAQMMNVVSESGLYALIFTSRKPEAKAFRKWVTGTVLPTLRREGVFVMQDDAPRTPGLLSDEVTQREVSTLISLVRTAASVKGPGAARRIWDNSLLAQFDGGQGIDLDDVPGQARGYEYRYAEDMRDVQRFLQECYVITGRNSDVVTSSDLNRAYAEWRAAQGLREIAKGAMAMQLKDTARRYVCPTTGRRMRPGKSGIVVYHGLHRRPAAQSAA